MSEDAANQTKLLTAIQTGLLSDISTPDIPLFKIIAGPESGSFFTVAHDSILVIGSSSICDIILSDIGISSKHIIISRNDNDILIKDLKSRNGVRVNSGRISEMVPVKRDDKILIGKSTIIHFDFCTELEFQYEKHISKQLCTDELTQTHNRKSFLTILNKEYLYAKNQGTSLSVLMIDIDHFKNINDNHGHLFGDEVLATISKLLLGLTRSNEDTVCRYGREKFAIITPTDKRISSILAERIRSTIERTAIDISDQTLNITVSIGVSSFPEDNNTQLSMLNLMHNSDQAMHKAKNCGRNKVELFNKNLSE